VDLLQELCPRRIDGWSAWEWLGESCWGPSSLALRRVRQQQGIKTITKQRQDNDDNTDDGNNDEEKKRSTKNRKSKHAPTEVSSKKRDFYSRQQNTTSLGSRGINFEAAGIVHYYKPHDPRSMIDGSSGSKRIDEEYEFLDDIMKTEMDTLKQRIAAWKATGRLGKKAMRKLNICNTGSLEEDQQKLKQLKEQLTQRQRAAAQRAAKVTLKRRMEQDIAEGKTGAYYLKRKERRKLELEATFEELRKRGGDNAINKAMAKRRKKNASKDHKYIPRSEPT
jgi:ribosomal RNA-processing protein 36